MSQHQHLRGRDYSKLSRLLCALEFIASHRFGVTREMLVEHLSDLFGTGVRTSHRDAARLASIGFVIDDRSEGFSRLSIDRTKIVPSILAARANERGE